MEVVSWFSLVVAFDDGTVIVSIFVRSFVDVSATVLEDCDRCFPGDVGGVLELNVLYSSVFVFAVVNGVIS